MINSLCLTHFLFSAFDWLQSGMLNFVRKWLLIFYWIFLSLSFPIQLLKCIQRAAFYLPSEESTGLRMSAGLIINQRNETLSLKFLCRREKVQALLCTKCSYVWILASCSWTLTWKWKSLSHVWLFVTPWTIQSMEFLQEWVAFPFFRWSSQPRDRTQVSRIAGGFFTSWATRKAQEYWGR